MNLTERWEVTQDVHDLGEELGIFREDFPFGQCAHLISDFEPVERLAALQILLSDHPYYGRELRCFNAAPWWYRCTFDAPDLEGMIAFLRFQSVDYYCRAYLNGTLVGGHEGYFEPFEFEVSGLLKERDNRLFVRVWAPWDDEVLEGAAAMRCFSVKRAMVKGTYEHADGFIQRDVNPVGICGPVELRVTPRAGWRQAWNAAARLEKDGRASVAVSADLAGDYRDCQIRCSVCDEMGLEVAGTTVSAACGCAELTVFLEHPRLWSCWERGAPTSTPSPCPCWLRGSVWTAYPRKWGYAVWPCAGTARSRSSISTAAGSTCAEPPTLRMCTGRR